MYSTYPLRCSPAAKTNLAPGQYGISSGAASLPYLPALGSPSIQIFQANDSQWVILRRRLVILGYVLIVPEMVITSAARQYFGAKYFAKRHQRRGWTVTHAFFLLMGGFTLHDEGGTPLRILEPIELERLSEAGKIKWPSITEEEIQDRSKGDHLSKGVVLIQTSWFIFQCIVRGAYYKLEVTELEVATLAFAVLTGVIYYLWWYKPLDVRCSVPVYLLSDDEKEKDDSQSISSISPAANLLQVPPSVSCDFNSSHVDSQSSSTSGETQILQQTLVVMPSDPEPPSKSSDDNATTIPEPQFTGRQQFSAFIRRHCQTHGTVLGLAYLYLLYPLFSSFGAFHDMAICDGLDDSMPLRVPIFYSPKFTDYNPNYPSLTVTMCVAIIFGGIHCVAGLFHFPTIQERLAWRISASSVAGLPILIAILAVLVGDFNVRFQGREKIMGTAVWFVVVLLVLYVIARIVLLVLSWITLRVLDPMALVEIQWTTFFPHID